MHVQPTDWQIQAESVQPFWPKVPINSLTVLGKWSCQFGGENCSRFSPVAQWCDDADSRTFSHCQLPRLSISLQPKSLKFSLPVGHKFWAKYEWMAWLIRVVGLMACSACKSRSQRSGPKTKLQMFLLVILHAHFGVYLYVKWRFIFKHFTHLKCK